ncbi:hypothetical protein QIH93_14915 [Bradyrhizobium ottawaense]|nr:hypothetical protein [Bradyrhizobium ottawaense]WLB49203.1 hypothetical protein QIH93_14915 [Bradyrhizobium ottawaense]
MKLGTNPYDASIAPIVGGSIAAAGIIPWLIGRACKYVLSGQ